MELSKTHLGQTPFITNVTVFNATVINDGAALVSGATSTAHGATITLVTSTADMLNYIGVTQVGSSFATQSKENLAPSSHAFGIPSNGIPNTGSLTTVMKNYLPLCINSDVSYMAQYSTTTGAGTASNNVATWTASTGTVIERGTTGIDIIGGWIFTLAGVNSAGNTPTFSGSLRYISNNSATTNIAVLTAINISTDSHAIWCDRTWKLGGTLTTTADFLRSQSGASGTGFQLNGSHMIGIENWCTHDQRPLHPLRFHVDDGNDGLTGVRIYKELVFSAPFLQDLA